MYKSPIDSNKVKNYLRVVHRSQWLRSARGLTTLIKNSHINITLVAYVNTKKWNILFDR